VGAMCKILVFTGTIVGLAYLTEIFTAWYSASQYEQFMFLNRAFGPVGWAFWIMVSCNVIAPQLLWFRRVRNSLLAVFVLSLVVSVHSVVSTDFATAVIPGWHATLFPPYFVAGAVYSGFAMVLTLAIPVRHFYKLHDFITMRHIENMAKITLATGLIVFYGYLVELFFGWYSGNEYEQYMVANRMGGPYAFMYWTLIFCNGFTPQLLWFRSIRRNLIFLWVISIVVNIGMWLERFVIVVTSLHRDFLPSSWDMYYPTFWDIILYVGTIGQFLLLFFLFLRFVPMIAMFEMKHLVHKSEQLKEG
jgi:hypothetical protein